jgi:predicted nucleic acid-binding protein
MPKTVYDTRFFIELYYSKEQEKLNKIKAEKNRREKYVSTISIHEVYKLTLSGEGRQTAHLRTTLLEKDFKLVPVTAEIAKASAEIRHKHKLSMGDSIIAATAQSLNAIVVSDDPHFQDIKEIATRWI